MPSAKKKGSMADMSLEEIRNTLTPRYWQRLIDVDAKLEQKLVQKLEEKWGIVDLSNEKRKAYLLDLDNLFKVFGEAGWNPPQQVRVVGRYLDSDLKNTTPVQLWIHAHELNDDEAVCDCIYLKPPQNITILKRLKRKGSQKIVFEASWGLYQKTVILKKLLSPDSLLREQRSHPLTHDHPNIIKTHRLSNAEEEFLVEEKLDPVLDDNWRAQGTEQVARLIHDIAAALAYLKAHELVHGDVKPDNIGMDQERFVLLDFGVCRKASENFEDKSATGTLRTRAPELLTRKQPQSICSDVWALGTTACLTLSGAFPLIDKGEDVPHVSDEGRRSNFEELLRTRVEEEYSERIEKQLSYVKDPRLKEVLAKMLNLDPLNRPTPEEVSTEIRDNLPHAVPNIEGAKVWGISWQREANALVAMFPTFERMKQVPFTRLKKFHDRTAELASRLEPDDPLKSRLGEVSKFAAEAIKGR